MLIWFEWCDSFKDEKAYHNFFKLYKIAISLSSCWSRKSISKCCQTKAVTRQKRKKHLSLNIKNPRKTFTLSCKFSVKFFANFYIPYFLIIENFKTKVIFDTFLIIIGFQILWRPNWILANSTFYKCLKSEFRY